MIGLIVRHPPIVVILEVDCSAEDGPIPRHHFIQAGRLEGDMMQRRFDDRHCGLPKLFHIHRSAKRCLEILDELFGRDRRASDQDPPCLSSFQSPT